METEKLYELLQREVGCIYCTAAGGLLGVFAASSRDPMGEKYSSYSATVKSLFANSSFLCHLYSHTFHFSSVVFLLLLSFVSLNLFENVNYNNLQCNQ